MIGERAPDDIDPLFPAVFDDVPADHWSAKYIKFCADEGIIDGVNAENLYALQSPGALQCLNGTQRHLIICTDDGIKFVIALDPVLSDLHTLCAVIVSVLLGNDRDIRALRRQQILKPVHAQGRMIHAQRSGHIQHLCIFRQILNAILRLQLAGVLLAVVSQRLLTRRDGNGRIAAFEIMVGTPPVQSMIREAKSGQLPSALETGFKDGMITMRRALEELLRKNLVSGKEVESLSLDAKQVNPF